LFSTSFDIDTELYILKGVLWLDGLEYCEPAEQDRRLNVTIWTLEIEMIEGRWRCLRSESDSW
jgi:hypothetical protein